MLQNYIKSISNGLQTGYGGVLLNLKNPTQLMTLKKVECSSHKWPPKFASSMASLHKNGLIFQTLHHSVVSEPFWTVKKPLIYIYLELGILSQLSPNIWPQKGLQILEKRSKSTIIGLKSKKIQTIWLKTQNWSKMCARFDSGSFHMGRAIWCTNTSALVLHPGSWSSNPMVACEFHVARCQSQQPTLCSWSYGPVCNHGLVGWSSPSLTGVYPQIPPSVNSKQ
jgi:hypothetical protein